jgi:hypothetical protein
VSFVWEFSKVFETKNILQQENFGNMYSSSARKEKQGEKQTEA